MLGGSSSINGLVYVRGNPHGLRALGGGGRARLGLRATCCPISAAPRRRAEGGDAYRGDDGPLQTRYGRSRTRSTRAFIEAARQAGYPATDDVNGFQQEGFGRLDMTVHDGPALVSAANAYLRPAMQRPNLAVAHPRAGDRASCSRAGAPIGVDYRRGGRRRRVRGAARGDPLRRARSTRRSS